MGGDFAEECVRVANKYRGLHNTAALKVNKELNGIAQAWADNLAAKDEFKHAENKYKGKPLGENLTAKFDSRATDYTAQAAIDNWYSEVTRFDFNTCSGQKTGHFSQLVWKGSQEMGIGKAKTKTGKWIVVGNFFPAGNVIGQYKENVMPPASGEIELPESDATLTWDDGSDWVREPGQGDDDVAEDFSKLTMNDVASESVQTKTKTKHTADGKTIVTTTVITTRTDRKGRKFVSTKETTAEK